MMWVLYWQDDDTGTGGDVGWYYTKEEAEIGLQWHRDVYPEVRWHLAHVQAHD